MHHLSIINQAYDNTNVLKSRHDGIFNAKRDKKASEVIMPSRLRAHNGGATRWDL